MATSHSTKYQHRELHAVTHGIVLCRTIIFFIIEYFISSDDKVMYTVPPVKLHLLMVLQKTSWQAQNSTIIDFLWFQ